MNNGKFAVMWEEIPDRNVLSQGEWNEWCRSRGLDPLSDALPSRRAWIPQLNTYLRNADILLYWDGALIAVGMKEEILQ